MSQTFKRIGNFLEFYIFPAVILLSLTGTLYIGFFLRQNENSNWLSAVEVGTSVVLSLALVLVYVIQNKILKQQSEIMSGGYTPAIGVQNVDFVDRSIEDFTSLNGYEDTVKVIQFEIENKGNDVATDVAVACYLFTHESRLDRLKSRLGKLTGRCPQHQFLPRRIDLESTQLLTEYRQSDGPVLPPNMDDRVTLFGNLGVNYEGSNYCSIPDACDILARADVDHAYLGLVLQYENAFGDTYELPIKSTKIDNLETGLTFEQIVSNMKRVPEGDFWEYSGTNWTHQ